jgi:hypothetical protein
MVKPEALEVEQLGAPGKLLDEVPRIARLGESEILTGLAAPPIRN